jgi:DnaJ-class molecular chaperone
MMIFVS